MATVVLVIHLMIAVALIAVVLMQRSEGGALGIGGGGGGGGFMSGRGTANLLTRMTTMLAAAFFITSITLTILAGNRGDSGSLLDRLEGRAGGQTDGSSSGGSLLDKIQPKTPSGPEVPQSQ